MAKDFTHDVTGKMAQFKMANDSKFEDHFFSMKTGLTKENIGTLSVQELFFQLIGWLGVELGVSPVGMVYFMG